MYLKLPLSAINLAAVAAVFCFCISNINGAPINGPTSDFADSGHHTKSISITTQVADSSTPTFQQIESNSNLDHMSGSVEKSDMLFNEVSYFENVDENIGYISDIPRVNNDGPELFIKYYHTEYSINEQNGDESENTNNLPVIEETERFDIIECYEPDCALRQTSPVPTLTLDENLVGVASMIEWFLKIGFCKASYKRMSNSMENDDDGDILKSDNTSFKKVALMKCKVTDNSMLLLQDKLQAISAKIPSQNVPTANFNGLPEHTTIQSLAVENNQLSRKSGQPLGDGFHSYHSQFASNNVRAPSPTINRPEEDKVFEDGIDSVQDSLPKDMASFESDNLNGNANSVE